MAIEYKGLTIRLGADTTELNSAIRGAKREMSGVPTELRKIERALKLDPGNVKLLAQQQADYRKAISSTERQLEALRAAEQQIGREGMSDEQWVRLQSDIAMCEQRLDGYRGALADSIVKQNAMESSLGKAGARLQAFGERAAPVGQKVERIGSALTRTVTPALLAVGAASVAAAVEVDDSLTGVRKTVDGTEQQYQGLKRAAVEFSKTNAVSASQILDIQALGAQLGYSIDELQEFGEVVSGLDIATNMSADEAATELAQFANIMGMAHDETRNYGSTIVALGNNFATTEADISSMAMRIAGAAKSIGLTEADVLGLATALSSMGIEAEAGGTAISTIMATIDRDVAMNSASIETWAATANMSVEEFKTAWGQDAVAALSAVLVGMDGAVQSGGNMSQMLDELGITSIRQTDTMKRLANNSEFLGRAVSTANRAWGENAALDAEVANRNESLSAQFEMLKNRVFAIAESYGGPLCRGMLDVVNAAEPLIEAIASGAKSFSEMSEGEQRTVLACLALSAAAGPMLSIFGKGVQNIQAVGRGMQSLAELIQRAKLASQEQTAATKAQEAASKASAAATRAQGTAATATAAGTTAMGTASTVAAGAMGVLRAALVALPLVGIVTLISGAVPMLMEWASGASEAAENTFNLTSASREHAEKVADLKARYEEACAAQGENSDAAARAKAAYDEEAAAFEESRQSLGQFVDECRGAVDGHGELMDSLREAKSDADSQAGAIMNLADQVSALMSVEGRSADQKARLSTLTDSLNEAVGREVVAYDEMTDSCSMGAEAVADLAKAEADRIRGEAAMKRYNSLIEESVSLDDQLERAQEELAAETERNVSSWGRLGDVQVYTSQAQLDLEQQVADLTAAQAENSDEQERALQLAQDMAAHDQALAQAVEAVKAGQMDASEAVEAYGAGLEVAVMETEVAAQAQSELAAESEELSEKVAKIAESLDEYCAASPRFAAAMADAGWTSEGLAQRLYDLGLESGDLTKQFEDLASKTCSAFDEIEQKQDVSLDKMLDTLRKNREATESWSENLARCYEKCSTDYERQFVDYVAGLGPEYATVLQMLADDTSGSFEAIAEEYGLGWDAVQAATAAGIERTAGEAATCTQQMSEAVGAAVSDMAERAGIGVDDFVAKMGEAGASVEDLEALTDDELAQLVQDYDGDMASIKRKLDEFVSKNRTSGTQGGQGLSSNYGAHRGAMSASASGLVGAATAQTGRLPGLMRADGKAGSLAFADGLPLYSGRAQTNAGKNADAAKIGMTKHNGSARSWGSHASQNFADGIRSGAQAVRDAASYIAQEMKAKLGHTIAEEGPLHEGGEGETRWGRHAVENYAAGMIEALPEIERASAAVAAVQASALSGASVSTEAAARVSVRHEAVAAARQTVTVRSDPAGTAEVRALSREVASLRRELPAMMAAAMPEVLRAEINGRELMRAVNDNRGAI